MKNKFSIILVIVVVIIISTTVLSLFLPKSKKQISINGNTMYVEVADNSFERMKGLMNRTRLDPDSGMIFIFDDERYHSFWMKNTLIPLDMLWINESGNVVYIEHSAPPCKENVCPTYGSPLAAKYIIEMPGGYSINKNIKIGDKVSLENL